MYVCMYTFPVLSVSWCALASLRGLLSPSPSSSLSVDCLLLFIPSVHNSRWRQKKNITISQLASMAGYCCIVWYVHSTTRLHVLIGTIVTDGIHIYTHMQKYCTTDWRPRVEKNYTRQITDRHHTSRMQRYFITLPNHCWKPLGKSSGRLLLLISQWIQRGSLRWNTTFAGWRSCPVPCLPVQ